MKAIEYKVGNGNGVEAINEVNDIMQIAGADSFNIEMREAQGSINKYDYVVAERNASHAANVAMKFIANVANGTIDDGDIFDYINETGDVDFMNIVSRSIDTNIQNAFAYDAQASK